MRSTAQRFAFLCGWVIVAPGTVKIEAVSKVSSWRKAGIAARVARQQAGRNRTVNAITGAVRTTARSFGHAIHQLWLEVTGSVFLFMALFGAIASIREYMKYTAGRTTPSHVAIAICFTLAFGWFGLSSFRRVKRKGQRS
jgi:F0F1-type ATP synthase membrane subunit a